MQTLPHTFDALELCGFTRFHGDRARLIDWTNHLDVGEVLTSWNGSGWNLEPFTEYGNVEASHRALRLLISRAQGLGFDAYLQDNDPRRGGGIYTPEAE